MQMSSQGESVQPDMTGCAMMRADKTAKKIDEKQREPSRYVAGRVARSSKLSLEERPVIAKKATAWCRS